MDAVTPTPEAGGEQNYRKPSPGKEASPPMSERRRRLLQRTLLPIIGLSLAAFVAGVVMGGSGGSNEPAERFAAAWEQQDFTAMYAELTPEAQAATTLEAFTALYVDAQSMATATSVNTGEVADADDGAKSLTTTVETLAFGAVAGDLVVGVGEEARIAWQPHLVFPGLEAGEVLERTTRVGERAPLLARNGSPLAEGPASARTSPLGTSALAIAGAIGSPSRKQERELFALGFPPGSLAGTSGLELAFNARLAGQPSGQLFATDDPASPEAGRVLASGEPTPGEPVKTTINPEVQTAAVSALGASYGGLAVLNAKNGDVAGVAGLAFSAPQPPGSTFKVVTATAGLDAGVVKTTDEFPVETSNSLIGREISNSHDSACGGTFVQSFAKSCNTVFAPLGVDVGVEKMMEMTEAFGFNSPPALADEASLEALAPPESTLPRPESDIALGEASIGQGQMLATPLQMASVAQTIANEGVRSPTSLVRNEELRSDAEPVQVTSPEVADTMKQLMIEVVKSGTGVAGAVSGIQVAGKTGTAELGPRPGQVLGPDEEPEQIENAWFTAFAPADNPKYAIAVMIIDAPGDGGTIAAPIAQQVLTALLAG